MTKFLPYFRTLAFFEGLDDASILALVDRLPRRRLIAGETFCRAGDEIDAACVVLRGGIEVVSAGGRQLTIVRAGGGFGLECLYSGHPTKVTAIAMGETWVFEIARDVFDVACEGEDPVGRLLLDRATHLLAAHLRLFDAALSRFEALAKTRTKAAAAPREEAPTRIPMGEAPTVTSDADLLEWAGQVAKQSGISNPDAIKVVQSAEIPLRRGPIS